MEDKYIEEMLKMLKYTPILTINVIRSMKRIGD